MINLFPAGMGGVIWVPFFSHMHKYDMYYQQSLC
jgi:hypothetical protein